MTLSFFMIIIDVGKSKLVIFIGQLTLKMNLLDYTRKPYPVILSRWGIILVISPFISIFMVIFQPFGLQDLESDSKSLLLAGYGLVTFVVLCIDLFLVPIIFPSVFKEEKWTVLREIIYLIFIIVTIAAGNYLYSVLLSIVSWVGIKGFTIFTGFTLCISIIPIIGVIMISHNTMLRKNLKASFQLNQMIMEKNTGEVIRNDKLVITSENRNQKIETPASHLICVESEGNYVNTWFLEEGKIVRLIIRNTIKNIEAQIMEAGNLFKCHRAYIINLSQVEKVTGNSQGYRLSMKYLDKEIPVARNYSKSFKEAISKTL